MDICITHDDDPHCGLKCPAISWSILEITLLCSSVRMWAIVVVCASLISAQALLQKNMHRLPTCMEHSLHVHWLCLRHDFDVLLMFTFVDIGKTTVFVFLTYYFSVPFPSESFCHLPGCHCK